MGFSFVHDGDGVRNEMLSYAKPKIAVLDDDQLFLNTIEYCLKEHFGKMINPFAFANPEACVNFIQNNCFLPFSPTEILSAFYTNGITKNSIENTLIDLSEMTSILVIDQLLQGYEKNGCEISTELREFFPTTYIAMMTGNVNMAKAVQLHNNRVIDLFISKHSDNAVQRLCKYLDLFIDEQKKSFTYSPFDAFKEETNLNSKEYLERKMVLLENVNFKSYITIDKSGSIALLDQTNNVTYHEFLNDK